MASYIRGFLQSFLGPTPPSSDTDSVTDSEDNGYYPASPSDVYHAAWVLQHFLPYELVIYTVDLAEYWPRLSVEDGNVPDRIVERRSPSVRVQLPIETFNSGRPNPVRKITIDIWGHDQGWCSSPDDGSWTWYTLLLNNPGDQELRARQLERKVNDTVGSETKGAATKHGDIKNENFEDGRTELNNSADQELALRPSKRNVNDVGVSETKNTSKQHGDVDYGNAEDGEPEHVPFMHRLATNPQANRTSQHYQIVWYPEEAKEEPLQGECPAALFRQLDQGSILQVQAHALFPGWVNHVDHVKMEAFIALMH